MLINLEFADRFLKKTQTSNFMKNRPVETAWFHADGRTEWLDHDNRRFSQFWESASKGISSNYIWASEISRSRLCHGEGLPDNINIWHCN